MIIREGVKEDAPEITKINIETWKTSFRGIIPDEYLQQLGGEYSEREIFARDFLSMNEKNFIFIAQEPSGHIVGYVMGGPERTGNTVYQGEVYAIYVLMDYQRKGIGKELIQAASTSFKKDDFSSFLIWTLFDSPYRRFYESIGGDWIETKTVEVRGFQAKLVAYGWTNIDNMISLIQKKKL